MKVQKIEIYRLELPLVKPYHISFGDIHCFDTIITIARADGQVGFGETTPLEGYSWESPEHVWDLVKEMGAEIVGMDIAEAKTAVLKRVRANPFAVTTLMAALEDLEGAEILEPPKKRVGVRILGLLNESTPEGIEQAVPVLIDEGYRTIKFKVGFKVDEDIEKVRLIQSLLGGGARLRLDANQNYSFKDAMKFGEGVDTEGVELLEQPLAAEDWDGMAKLAEDYPLPLMLDEAIYSSEEIERAAKLNCARFIKLKLMKCGGAARMAEEIKLVQDLGMEIVVGNGVSSDINCYHEALVYHHMGLTSAGEMNGFLKPLKAVVKPRLSFENGQIMLEPGLKPEIDRDNIELFSAAGEMWEA